MRNRELLEMWYFALTVGIADLRVSGCEFDKPQRRRFVDVKGQADGAGKATHGTYAAANADG
jgi:hypothetical protein